MIIFVQYTKASRVSDYCCVETQQQVECLIIVVQTQDRK